jgi:hypothetical protein
MKNAPVEGTTGALGALNETENHRSSASKQSSQPLPIEIAKFWKNRQRRESVHVVLSEYEGHPLVDARVWCTGSDGIDRPTKKGLAVGVAKLPELTRALLQAEAKAYAIGLIAGSSC